VIHVNAETAEDIAALLRGERKLVDEKKQAELLTDKLLGKKSDTGIIITAPRRSGKTMQLLRFAEDKYTGGRYAIVSINHEVQRSIIRMHWELHQASNLLKKLTGKEAEGIDVNPPLMLTPDTIHLHRGSAKPIFVDEWNSLQEETQQAILKTGYFVAAVTS
jgi:hypothetical protein